MYHQIVEILKAEISSYYTKDDLPVSWNESALRGDIPRMASDSADRLRRRAGVNNVLVSDLVDTIDHVEKTALSDFALSVSNIYTPDWNTPENQAVLKFIFSLISNHLRA